jgi:hypothetical protein
VGNFSEGFYKDFRQLVEYKNGARLLMNPCWSRPAAGQRKAYGVEVSIHKNKGNLPANWATRIPVRWLSSGQTSPQNNQRRRVFSSVYDKPHNLTGRGSCNWAQLTLGTNFVYSTGGRLLSRWVVRLQ